MKKVEFPSWFLWFGRPRQANEGNRCERRASSALKTEFLRITGRSRLRYGCGRRAAQTSTRSTAPPVARAITCKAAEIRGIRPSSLLLGAKLPGPVCEARRSSAPPSPPPESFERRGRRNTARVGEAVAHRGGSALPLTASCAASRAAMACSRLTDGNASRKWIALNRPSHVWYAKINQPQPAVVVRDEWNGTPLD